MAHMQHRDLEKDNNCRLFKVTTKNPKPSKDLIHSFDEIFLDV